MPDSLPPEDEIARLREEKEDYFVVDFRAEWLRQPYITFWGPKSAGYYWSLPHAGRYTAAELDTTVGYHTNRCYVVSRGARVGRWERFGVPCKVLEALAAEPDTEGRYRLDDGGPVVRNSAALRKRLVALRYVPRPNPKREDR